jgi:hypothetical protein
VTPERFPTCQQFLEQFCFVTQYHPASNNQQPATSNCQQQPATASNSQQQQQQQANRPANKRAYHVLCSAVLDQTTSRKTPATKEFFNLVFRYSRCFEITVCWSTAKSTARSTARSTAPGNCPVKTAPATAPVNCPGQLPGGALQKTLFNNV